MTDFIPVAMPDISELEENYALEAVRSTWISSRGRFLDRAESEIAEISGKDHCLLVSNGTVALHLILLALGVKAGDEVIVPSLTYVATANAVTYVGGTPVFVDVERESWCIDPNAVAAAVSERTVGIIAVDLYGNLPDFEELKRVAAKRKLWILEDAAEAPFASNSQGPAGSFGLASSFSFFGNKVITSGEGGAVVTSDGELARKMRLIRNQGMDPERRYYFPVIGHNFRMTNVTAAILCGQLERSQSLLESRRQVFDHYFKRLSESNQFVFQTIDQGITVSPWMFSVLVRFATESSERDEIIETLAERGIETRPLFIPVDQLPPYVNNPKGDLAVTYDLSKKGISLPTYSQLTESEIHRICSELLEATEWLAE